MASVLDRVLACAAEEECTRVHRVVLEIGSRLTVEPEALRFCFGAMARGTAAEGAALELTPVAGGGRMVIRAIEVE